MRLLVLSLVLAAAPSLALAQTGGTDQSATQATGTDQPPAPATGAATGTDQAAPATTDSEPAAGASGDAAPAGDAQALPPGTEMADGEIVFRSALTDKPLDMTYRPDQEITEAVTAFHKTGQNPYVGDEAATADGKKTYAKLCAPCHLPSGAGRIGPSLLDDEWRHPRLDTEVGRFEIIYGGGAGAMQAFGKRIPQDEILRVMAYVDALRAGAAKK